MDPLTFHVNALSESETSRILLAAECFELGISFACATEFGFVSEAYPEAHPDTPFKSLALLIMLERIQSWLDLDFESASRLIITLYGEGPLSFVETERQFSARMAWVIIENSQKEIVLHRPDLTPDEYQKILKAKLDPISLKVRRYQSPP